jgi:hypothetical protein
MKRSTRLPKALLLVSFLLGCSADIPNTVSADEYTVFSEWIATHFSKSPPTALYVRNRTAAFDPFHCGEDMQRAGVPRSLMKQLQALGDAEFRLHLESKSKLSIPWDFMVLDDWGRSPEPPPTGAYRLLNFSRVAFDRQHTQALFLVNDSCGGECGIGGAVLARKVDGRWIFEDGGCRSIAMSSGQGHVFAAKWP